MTACSGFLPDSTEKASECIYRSRPGIETLYLHLPGVHVEDNRLLPLRYSHQPKSALKSPTLQTVRIHNSRAYFFISSPEERMSQRVDFLASDVVHPCYLVASSPLNCQRHAKAITLHLLAQNWKAVIAGSVGAEINMSQ
jgi:hypothetical protein